MLLGDVGCISLLEKSAGRNCVLSDVKAVELISAHTRRATGGGTRPSMTFIDVTIFELKGIITDSLTELGIGLRCPCIVMQCL